MAIGGIGSTDRYDLRALELAAAWGYQRERVLAPLRRCGRPFCGGSIVASWGTTACLLCARDPDGVTQVEPEWARLLSNAEAQIPPR